MGNDLRWMLGSDFHIPYHDKRYVELWFKVMRYIKPDVVDYLGDIDDQSCFSRFSDGTPDELLGRVSTYAGDVRNLYQQTVDIVPNSQRFVALGNHDVRAFGYVEKKAPALMDTVTPESLWGLDSLGYDYIHYGDLPKHRFGDMHAHHGVFISKHSAQSVKSDIDDFDVSIVRGHSHRQGVYMHYRELSNRLVRGYEIGHLTDIKSSGMSYTNVHNWQAGFAIGVIESGFKSTDDGYWPHLQLITVSPDYTCYVGNRRIAA